MEDMRTLAEILRRAGFEIEVNEEYRFVMDETNGIAYDFDENGTLINIDRYC